MKYNLFFLSLTLFSAISCTSPSKQEKIEVVDLETIPTVRVTTQATAYDEYTLYPKSGFLTGDSLLVVFEPKCRDNFICVYNDRCRKPLRSLGIIGEGKDDFVNPRLIPGGRSSVGEEAFLVGDARRLCLFRADSLLCDLHYQGTTLMPIPPELKLYNYLIHYSDSLLIVAQTGEHQLTFYDRKSGKVSYKNCHYSHENLEVNSFIRCMDIYDACYTSNGSRIAVAYKNWNEIDILSLTGEVVKRLFLPDYACNRQKFSLDATSSALKKADDMRVFFTFAASTPDCLYALSWNATKAEIREGKALSTVYKLDWEGNVLGIFRFDKPISSFCLQGDELKYAIGLSPEDGEVHLFDCTFTHEKEAL